MKKLLCFLALSAALFAAPKITVAPKITIEVNGKAYLYADVLITTTGRGFNHYIVIHAADSQFDEIRCYQFTDRFWPVRVSGPGFDVPLGDPAAYLIYKVEGRFVVDILGDSPATDDEKKITEFVRSSIIKPQIPIVAR